MAQKQLVISMLGIILKLIIKHCPKDFIDSLIIINFFILLKMSQENINEAWADTEAGVATNIDINTKCDFEIDTKTAPKWSRDKKI